LGPVGQALVDVEEETRAAVLDALRAAYAPYVDGGEVRFNAACWSVGAESR
jgi:hypothetical protein